MIWFFGFVIRFVVELCVFLGVLVSTGSLMDALIALVGASVAMRLFRALLKGQGFGQALMGPLVLAAAGYAGYAKYSAGADLAAIGITAGIAAGITLGALLLAKVLIGRG